MPRGERIEVKYQDAIAILRNSANPEELLKNSGATDKETIRTIAHIIEGHTQRDIAKDEGSISLRHSVRESIKHGLEKVNKGQDE